MKRLAIVLTNCIIVLLVALSVIYYANRTAENSVIQSKNKFEDTTTILEEIASNYLQDSQDVSNRWAALINGGDFTMESAIAMTEQMIVQENVSAQLVWADSLTGMASQGKAANPEDHTVDYSKSNLQSVLSDVNKEGDIHITHRYSNPQTGGNVVAFLKGGGGKGFVEQ